MESLILSLEIVLPLFLLMALGYVHQIDGDDERNLCQADEQGHL